MEILNPALYDQLVVLTLSLDTEAMELQRQVILTLTPYVTLTPLSPTIQTLLATQKWYNRGYANEYIFNWGQPDNLAPLWRGHAMRPQLDEPL